MSKNLLVWKIGTNAQHNSVDHQQDAVDHEQPCVDSQQDKLIPV
jgi:hypothetical protein